MTYQNKLAVREGLPNSQDPVLRRATEHGILQRYPVRAGMDAARFFGQVGDLDVWADTSDVFNLHEDSPIFICHFVGRATPSIERVRGWTEIATRAKSVEHLNPNTFAYALGLVCKALLNEVGIDEVSRRMKAEEDCQKRLSDPCAGCGKPSAVFLDDARTTRLCAECLDLVDGGALTPDQVQMKLKVLRDPVARHRRWEQHVRVWSGAPVGGTDAEQVVARMLSHVRLMEGLEDEKPRDDRRAVKRYDPRPLLTGDFPRRR